MAPIGQLIDPRRITSHLLRHRELIVTFAKREFQAAHRGTYLGLAWSVLSPLIMLALFAFVFGGIFKGRFNPNIAETHAEFALALFIGLAYFNAFSQNMSAAGNLILANSIFVKSLSFPLEVLSVASVLNVLSNLGISLAICIAAHLLMYGYLHITTLWLLPLTLALALGGLGISWLLSGLCVFIRDIPAIITPINTVLMFISGVFFPLSVMSPRVRYFMELNPLAVLIDQARGALMYGLNPSPWGLVYVLICGLALALAGHVFFMRAKSAFADVI
jgi:lipopolysaccharide transport system permease protein